jgi:thiol-disulfide isomerase/thioredoxin
MTVTMKTRHLDRRSLLCAAAGLLPATLGCRPAFAAPATGDADAPTPRPWPAGKATPGLSLPSVEGPLWSLASARGEVVVLNFWASWCEPCRSELPSLELLATRHAGDKLQVLTVNFRETDAAIDRFVQAQPLTLPILRDRDGGAAKDWGVRIFPTTVVVGRNGRAAFSVIGEVDWAGAAAKGWLAPLLR